MTENNPKTQLDSTFWSGLVATGGELVSGFNYKQQANEIELARLQAEAANANSAKDMVKDMDYGKMALIGAVILVVAFLIFKK